MNTFSTYSVRFLGISFGLGLVCGVSTLLAFAQNDVSLTGAMVVTGTTLVCLGFWLWFTFTSEARLMKEIHDLPRQKLARVMLGDLGRLGYLTLFASYALVANPAIKMSMFLHVAISGLALLWMAIVYTVLPKVKSNFQTI